MIRLNLLLWLLPMLAMAHGPQPRVTGFVFPAPFNGQAWAVTNNQGIYAHTPDGYQWLCEDAAAPGAGVIDLVAVTDTHWVIATDSGVFLTTDAGCNYHQVDESIRGHHPVDLSIHPLRPQEIVLATNSFGRLNDIYRTTDGGRSWVAAGFDLRLQFHQLLRSEANPELIYTRNDRGAFRSEDAGESFDPIALGPPNLDPRPNPMEFRLLGTDPLIPNVVFAALERFPATLVMRSEDAGATWLVVTEVDDLPVSFLIKRAGDEAAVFAQFAGFQYSDDGGQTWGEPVDSPIRALDCLTRDRNSDRLWACTDTFFGGPWPVGRSDDFGRSWQLDLARFEDVERWPCPDESRAALCCDGLCPGQPVGNECEDQVEIDPQRCADTDLGPPLDARLPDAATPDAAQPDAAQPDAAQPDAAQPDAAQPDARSPDAAQLDMTRPDVAQPDAHPVDLAIDAQRPDAAIPDQSPLPQTADAIVRPDGGEVVGITEPDSGCNQIPAPLGWLWLCLWPVLRRRDDA